MTGARPGTCPIEPPIGRPAERSVRAVDRPCAHVTSKLGPVCSRRVAHERYAQIQPHPADGSGEGAGDRTRPEMARAILCRGWHGARRDQGGARQPVVAQPLAPPPNQAPDSRLPEATAARSSRSSHKVEHGALAPHFRLLELGGGNRPVESGAQLLGCLQRQLNPSPCPGFEGNVDEVESVERRAGTKGNVDQQRTRRTQRRISVSQMLARIRQHIVAVDTQGGNRMRECCTYGTPLWTGFTRWGAAHSSLSPTAMAAIARA
jgi:hypothetical protein